MAEHDLSAAGPECLARLLQMSEGHQPLWTSQELAAICRHQLSAPIEYDLRSLSSDAARKTRFVSAAQGLLLRSFADLFSHPQPPLELLELTKEFAKGHRNQPESPLPVEVSTLLYYASVAAALLRCRQRISGLTDQALREGLEWAAALDWVEEPIHQLFAETLSLLNEGGRP